MTAVAAPLQRLDTEWSANWRAHLLDLIQPAWRPHEYDHGQMIFVPAGRLADTQCARTGCEQTAVKRTLCPQCRHEKWLTGTELEQFVDTPVPADRPAPPITCLVGCQRAPLPSGLCRPHGKYYRHCSEGVESHAHVLAWIAQCLNLEVLPPRERCIVGGCGRDRALRDGLCDGHHYAGKEWIKRWNTAGRQPNADMDL
jgi:hypothetical protein